MQTITVNPIRPGYEFGAVITFSPYNAGDALGFSFLQTSRILGQFRSGSNKTSQLFASADTNNQGIVVLGADTIRLQLAAATTRLFIPGRAAWVDFAFLLQGAWYYIPALIPWPVIDTVTDPAQVT